MGNFLHFKLCNFEYDLTDSCRFCIVSDNLIYISKVSSFVSTCYMSLSFCLNLPERQSVSTNFCGGHPIRNRGGIPRSLFISGIFHYQIADVSLDDFDLTDLK